MAAAADEITVRTLLAALPGWHVAIYIESSNEFVFDAIVAWEIARTEATKSDDDDDDWHYVVVTPITLEGDLADSANITCVRTPDGSFDFVADRVFDTESNALTYAAELAAKAEAARLKRAAK